LNASVAGSTASSGGCTIIARCAPLERAAVQEEDLAAAVLLGRRAHHRHRQTDVVGDARETQARPDGRGGDDVVAAGVADVGQAVVLGADRDVERAAAGARAERGREPAHAGFDAESRGVERLGNPGGGTLLLEAELGMRVDAVRERDEVRAFGVDAFAGGYLGVHGRHRIDPRSGAPV
jgi:hypothetical protein